VIVKKGQNGFGYHRKIEQLPNALLSSELEEEIGSIGN
jgi:hypothetical protein